MAQRAAIASARRVVVKFGSALLSGNDKPFHRFAAQLNPLRDQGKSVVLVSSGAIAQGVARLQLKKRPPGLAFHQSLAAVGQPALMAQWAEAFGRTPVAQFLIGKHDVTDPLRFLNGRRALRSLEETGVIPIGNENDTVVTEEIRIGDNDNLGAYVARLVSADALIILTQVDGLYDSNPEKNPKAKLISTVQPNELELASTYASGASANGLGVGGFETKLQAARIATAWGIPVVVANGYKPSSITAVLNGEEEGTLFAVPEKAERKHWLQYRYPLCGQLELNDAAADAAENGQDIWLHDVKTVHGDFTRGDTVAIARSRDGVILGRGLVGYSSADMQKYTGLNPEALVAAMGNKAYDGAAIHREDYMLYAKRRLI